MKLRVLTYNIHHWEGIDGRIDVSRTAEVIRAAEADVIALNEVYHPAPVPGLDRPALDAMAEMLRMEAVFGQATTASWGDERAPTGYGNACLSRWPIQAYAAHRLVPVPGREQRGLLEVHIALPTGTLLTAYITHLDQTREDARWRQLQSLLQWTWRDRERPHLLMGDFNTLSSADYPEPEMWKTAVATAAAEGYKLEEPRVIPRLLQMGYVDCFSQAGKGEGLSCPTTEPRVRIDYIFASPSLAPALRWCRRWDAPPADVASDHYPVLALFELPG